MQTILLGIDIGTSACKVAFFGPDGDILAQRGEPYNVYYPKPGWAEQNPTEWWSSVCKAIKATISENNINVNDIAGIGIGGQSWSAIPLAGNGDVLCNTPIWMDTRAQDICDSLDEAIGEKTFFEICGNPLKPSYSLPKILWYKKYLPEVYEKTDKILQSNGYIAYMLTGKISMDLSQGYGFQNFNLRTGQFDFELSKEAGLRADIFPEVTSCHSIVGLVTKKAASETGLPEGIPVVAGGLDAALSTLGSGAIDDGETQEQGGQAGGMSIVTSSCLTNIKLITSYHVIPDRWLLQGGTVGGGGVLRWFVEQFGEYEKLNSKQNGLNVFSEITKLAEQIKPGSDGLIFLPYMSGERSPIWDPYAKGVYYGVDFSKTKGHFIRASLEGVAYSLKHNLETSEMSGATVKELRSVGGAANSLLWTQIKSDATGKPISVVEADTATTLGAAMLAGVAVGVYKDFEEATKRTVKIKRQHTPNPENTEIYNKAYNIYLEIYENLKSVMKKSSI
ncbi:MAG: FGGY-family carbohydrate kinase [Clostridiales bacterium]|jgi:xylulokinase|nr:FGGY-family carbohydrate kinase [Clostridiales bacterium]